MKLQIPSMDLQVNDTLRVNEVDYIVTSVMDDNWYILTPELADEPEESEPFYRLTLKPYCVVLDTDGESWEVFNAYDNDETRVYDAVNITSHGYREDIYYIYTVFSWAEYPWQALKQAEPIIAEARKLEHRNNQAV